MADGAQVYGTGYGTLRPSAPQILYTGSNTPDPAHHTDWDTGWGAVDGTPGLARRIVHQSQYTGSNVQIGTAD